MTKENKKIGSKIVVELYFRGRVSSLVYITAWSRRKSVGVPLHAFVDRTMWLCTMGRVLASQRHYLSMHKFKQ